MQNLWEEYLQSLQVQVGVAISYLTKIPVLRCSAQLKPSQHRCIGKLKPKS